MKKKLPILLLSMIILTLLLTGCGQTAQTSTRSNELTENNEPSSTNESTESNEPTSTSEPAPTSNSETIQSEQQTAPPENESTKEEVKVLTDASAVYMTTEITPEGLKAVYDALEWTPKGNLAIKTSTGEPPKSNYLRPELIGDFVSSLDGTIVECNTAYGGSRAETAMHYQVAEDHGFTSFADVDIMDENGSMELVVGAGDVLGGVNYVGANFANYDSMLVLSHFKGHAMAGFGGAIKNISIGISSSMGKVWIHSGGERTKGSINGNTDKFQMAMAEAGLSVSDALGEGENIVYINVMNRLSVDCDCDGNPAEPDIHDIGILASADPVALDQACLDLIWEAEGNKSFVQRVESRKGFLSIEYAEEIGLGSRQYELVSLD